MCWLLINCDLLALRRAVHARNDRAVCVNNVLSARIGWRLLLHIDRSLLDIASIAIARANGASGRAVGHARLAAFVIIDIAIAVRAGTGTGG